MLQQIVQYSVNRPSLFHCLWPRRSSRHGLLDLWSSSDATRPSLSKLGWRSLLPRFGFTNKLLRGETIQIYNYGNCRRDFTYVDDIVEGIVREMAKAPEKRNGEDGLPLAPYAVYNIGGGQPENLLDFVQTLQEELLRAGVLPKDYDFEAHKELVPMQPGDVPTTYADATALERDFGFTPKITLREGLRKFAEWYKSYYK